VHEEWTDRLSDYLDGELADGEDQAVEAHLRSCAACTAVLNDLKRVVARAATIEPRPPQADLWAGVAARIDASATGAPGRVMPFTRQTRRFAFTLPQLAAAAALLIAVSGGAAWQIALRTGRPEGVRYDSTAESNGARPALASGSTADRQVRPDTTATADAVPVSMADAQYDAAVSDLEKALKGGRGHLDASTVAVVEHNLQIIDQAINQAREALAGDPANTYLSGHLVEARRRKLDLLRRATALASETD